MDIPGIALQEQALKFRALRNEVLSANIANADTPHYKARDIDFGDALRSARQDTVAMMRTSSLHQSPAGQTGDGVRLQYRNPYQPALDGNTVEIDTEQAHFAENALQYRVSLAFLDGSIRTLRYALKGGE